MLVTGESTIGRCEPTYHAENRERAKMEIADRLTHLLPHWIEHNEAHAEQLAEWVAKARSAGMGEIADSISAAADAMRQANARLTHSRVVQKRGAPHCGPCLEYHLAEARGLGVSDDQIREAVKLAEAISRSGDRRMHEFAQKAIKGAGDPEESE